MLLVDAAQGIEAQTLANLYLALEKDLHDHPGAQQDRPARRRSRPLRRGDRAHHRLRARRRAAGVRQDRRGGRRTARRGGRARCPPPVGRRGRPGPRDDLRLGVRHLPRRRHLRPRGGRQDPPARADHDDVDRRHARTARGRHHLARAEAHRRPGRRRGRLPDHRCEGRPAVAGSATPSPPSATARPSRWPATATPSRWSTPACTRWTAPTTRCCATRWTSCGSTTPRWPTSRKRRWRSASASAAASSACCTWRSPATGSSASSAST